MFSDSVSENHFVRSAGDMDGYYDIVTDCALISDKLLFQRLMLEDDDLKMKKYLPGKEFKLQATGEGSVSLAVNINGKMVEVAINFAGPLLLSYGYRQPQQR